MQAQAVHSRLLEVEKLIHDTGKLGRRFFEALRKEVLHAETIKQEQPWQEATTQLVHYSAITALAGLKEAARAMEQKQGSIDEGGRNVTNLINDTMDGLGIQELKFCTQEERLRYEKGESEKFPECDMEIKGGGGGRFGSFM